MNQFFAPLVEPLGALWLLMALGVLWLLCRRQWRSALWLGIPTALLFVIGSTSLAEQLVAAEERPWTSVLRPPSSVLRPPSSVLRPPSSVLRPPSSVLRPPSSVLPPPSSGAPVADAVVALGGGHRVSQFDTLGFAVADGGSRLLTAIQLVRSGKAKTLVLGGSWPFPGKPGVPSMSVVQDWVLSWGCILQPGGQGTNTGEGRTEDGGRRTEDGGRRTEVGGQRSEVAAGGWVTNLGICINTHDEAVAFRNLGESQGWSNVVLVTSALHLRRSVALFRKQGIAVTAVAADFQVQGVSQDLPFSPFPRQRRLFLLALYLHEKVGWWVYRARGWI